MCDLPFRRNVFRVGQAVPLIPCFAVVPLRINAKKVDGRLECAHLH
jgi:hypothetical protein